MRRSYAMRKLMRKHRAPAELLLVPMIDIFIVLVTFLNEQRERGLSVREAVVEGTALRLRPVLMTALAMMIGMLPMALGFGEGGEQNAPLGRAVIGGLLVATFATLFFVPVIYSVLRRKPVIKVEENFADDSVTPSMELAH